MKPVCSVAGMRSCALVAVIAFAALAGCASKQEKPAPAPAPVAAEPAPVPVAESKPVCKDEPKAKGKKTDAKATKGKTAAPVDCVPEAQAKPPVAAAPVSASTGGYDLSKNKPVTDSTKVEAGQGTQVKGINDWQGEITGVPAANSRFVRLKIGMSQQQVFEAIGQPSDQGAYITGKAFIPFYFGSDRSRWEMVYKGQGRLIFSNQAGFGSGYYLTWIIHNSGEGASR
jgi:hypothetical protein